MSPWPMLSHECTVSVWKQLLNFQELSQFLFSSAGSCSKAHLYCLMLQLYRPDQRTISPLAWRDALSCFRSFKGRSSLMPFHLFLIQTARILWGIQLNKCTQHEVRTWRGRAYLINFIFFFLFKAWIRGFFTTARPVRASWPYLTTKTSC